MNGTALSRDAAALALPLEWRPNQGNFSLLAGYAGLVGDRNSDSSLQLGASFRF